MSERRDTLREIAELREIGFTATEALDFFAAETCGFEQTNWSKLCGVSQQTVSRNVSKGREKLAEVASGYSYLDDEGRA